MFLHIWCILLLHSEIKTKSGAKRHHFSSRSWVCPTADDPPIDLTVDISLHFFLPPWTRLRNLNRSTCGSSSLLTWLGHFHLSWLILIPTASRLALNCPQRKLKILDHIICKRYRWNPMATKPVGASRNCVHLNLLYKGYDCFVISFLRKKILTNYIILP